jgi:hypothetical protein
MVALTSTETNTVFGLHWPGEPRAARWPELNDSPGLVGKGLLMSNEGWGGGELPIHRVLKPEHREEGRATRNLAERRERQEECAITGRHKGRKKKNSGKIQSE